MTATHTLSSQQTARRTYVGLWIAATLGYVGLIVAGYELAGVGVFALGGAAAITLHSRANSSLFDERDATVLEIASAQTIRIVGLVSAVLFPSLVALSVLGYYSWTPFTSGVSLTVTAVFAVWATMLLAVRTRV